MKEKIKKLIQSLGMGATFAIMAALVVLVGGRAVLAVSETPAEEKLKISLANFLDNNPNSELAILLARTLSLGGVASGNESTGAVEELEKGNNPVRNVCFKDSDNQYQTVCEGWEEFDLPSTTTTYSEQNRLGQNFYIDYAEAELTGTVSSTFRLYLGVTNTPAGIPINATALTLPNQLIDGYQFVTSTTNIQDKFNYRNVVTMFNTSTFTNQFVRVATSSYVTVFLQAYTGTVCGADVCEPVTSTARGYSGKIRYHYHYRRAL